MGWDGMVRDGFGSDGFSVANLNSRNPQIGSFFCPLCEEAGRAGKTGCALGSRLRAATNDEFRGFFGSCEIVSLQTSEPRVAGSSPAGCIAKPLVSGSFVVGRCGRFVAASGNLKNPQIGSGWEAPVAVLSDLCETGAAARRAAATWPAYNPVLSGGGGRGGAAGQDVFPGLEMRPGGTPRSPRLAILLGELLGDLAHQRPVS